MHAKTLVFVAVALMQRVAAQQANVCGDSNLGGGCENISGDDNCYNLRRADWASSYRTNGLTCTFFDDNNCFRAVIGPVNGEDGNLRNGEFNDQINSVRCRR